MARKKLIDWLSKKKKAALIVGIWVIGTFILLNYVLLPAYVNQGETLNVPKVVGVSMDRAQIILDSIGLEAVQGETRMDPRMPVGTVVAQNPQANTVVKHGRRVYLTISGGETVVVVPGLRGRSERDAKFALERTGLVFGDITYAASESYPENTIIDQTVPAGKKIPKGSRVAVTVSRGKARSETVVPQLLGKTISEAERILARTGLRLGNITYQVSYDLLPSTVVDQFPRSGESVSDSQAVDLFVVKAGKPGDARE